MHFWVTVGDGMIDFSHQLAETALAGGHKWSQKAS